MFSFDAALPLDFRFFAAAEVFFASS